MVEYTYDAWGKPQSKTGILASTLGTDNPFRYRGYVWDEETGLYYLRSRYYNPEWGRFINADALLGRRSIVFSHNIFTYCANSPIQLKDPSGLRHEEGAGGGSFLSPARAKEELWNWSLKQNPQQATVVTFKYLPDKNNIVYFRDMPGMDGKVLYKHTMGYTFLFDKVAYTNGGYWLHVSGAGGKRDAWVSAQYAIIGTGNAALPCTACGSDTMGRSRPQNPNAANNTISYSQTTENVELKMKPNDKFIEEFICAIDSESKPEEERHPVIPFFTMDE